MNDTPHTLGPEMAAIAKGSASGAILDAARVINMDEIGANYIAEYRRASAVARWDAACPSIMHEINMDHAGLHQNLPAIRAVMAWEQQPRGMLITGPTGTGKSRASWQLMRKLAEQAREDRHFTASEFFTAMQARVNYGRDDAGEWVRAMARAPIVFIDDLGQEAVAASKQDWAQGWFFQFLDQRLGNALPLIITTNMTSEQIAGASTSQIRSDPLIRRLLELCEIVRFR